MVTINRMWAENGTHAPAISQRILSYRSVGHGPIARGLKTVRASSNALLVAATLDMTNARTGIGTAG
jgi:hypothetical protein